MSLDNESVESVSDVPAESSPAPEKAESESNAAPAQAEAAQTNQEKYVPYDRFKELVEQKNQFSRQFEETQKQLQELRSKLETPKSTEPTPQQKLAARLKGIDPEFGSTFEEMLKAQDEVKAWKSQQEAERQAQAQQAQAQQANSHLEKMQSEHKVSKAEHERFVAQIIRAGQMDNRLGVNDIPRLYKALHDEVAKEREEYKRTVLAEYTSTKSSDSKLPANGKGTSPKAAAKVEYSTDREVQQSQIVKRALASFQKHKAG